MQASILLHFLYLILKECILHNLKLHLLVTRYDRFALERLLQFPQEFLKDYRSLEHTGLLVVLDPGPFLLATGSLFLIECTHFV